MGKKKKPRIAPNGLESWELDHAEVIREVNSMGGLRDAMQQLSSFHIADPELAALFDQARDANQKAQAILNASMPEGERLVLGMRLQGRLI